MNGLDTKLTNPQKTNLIRLLTALLLLSTTTFSTIAIGWINVISVNALSHFMSYSGLCGGTLMGSAVRFAIKTMGLNRASVRLAIDDTMEHHSRFCRCIANVYNLFDHVLGTYWQAKCIVFAYIIINEAIRIPIDWKVYRQGEKKKWELALELIDQTTAHGFSIGVVLFDSWFCVKQFLQELQKRKLRFISEIKSNHRADSDRMTKANQQKRSIRLSR